MALAFGWPKKWGVVWLGGPIQQHDVHGCRLNVVEMAVIFIHSCAAVSAACYYTDENKKGVPVEKLRPGITILGHCFYSSEEVSEPAEELYS